MHHFASQDGAVFSKLGLETAQPALWFWLRGIGMTNMRALGMLVSPDHTSFVVSDHHQAQSMGLVYQPHTILHRRMERFSQSLVSKLLNLPRGFGCVASE